jgi:hemoglobin/transferrin/lactoferrin receptor protein
VLIQVDGVRVPDGFEFGAQSAGRGDYVDLGLIKSVEILRGPASALYGSDGLAGAVSFVTSDPVDFIKSGKSYGGLLRAAYDSSSDQFAETGILAGRAGDVSAMVSYTRRDGHEYDNKGSIDAPNSTRTTPNPQDARSNAILGKLVWTPTDSMRIRLTYDHLDSRTFTNVLSGVAPVASTATSVIGLTALDNIKRDRVSLDWRYQGGGVIEFAQVTGWYQWAKNRQFTFEDRNTAADRTRINTFDNRVWGLSVDLRSSFGSGDFVNKLAYGADLSVTRQSGLRDGTVPTPPDVFPTRAFPPTDYVLGGAYLADTIELAGGRLKLFPALRFDYYKLTPKPDALTPALPSAGQDGSRLSPKIGALAKVTDEFSLFVNYARGFRAPSPTQINQFFSNPTQGYTSIPNPNLRPETSETWEGGFRLGTGAVRLAATAFTGGYKGFISQEVVGGAFTPVNPAIFQFINLNRVRIRGAEGGLSLTDPSGLNGRLAVSYAQGTVTGGTGIKSPLSTIDPMKLVIGVGYDDPDKRFGGQVIATHARQKELSATSYYTGSTLNYLCTTACFRPGAFTILDATAYVKVAGFVTLRAGIFNILDAKYAWWSDVRGLADSSTVQDAYTQAGRNASVSVSVRF